MADLTRQSFKWSETKYTLREVEEVYGDTLPQMVLVADGYSSSNSPYTMSSGDIFFLKSIVKQPRLVVEDERGRQLSIPLDYKLKFSIVRKPKSGTIAFGPARKLREILHHNSRESIGLIRLELNQSVSVLKGAEDTMSGALGIMVVHDIYYERYYVAHTLFENGMMHPYQVEFPVYVPITVQLAVGLTVSDDKKMAGIFSRAMELISSDRGSNEPSDIAFNQEIMLFEEQDDEGYQWVNMDGSVDWVFPPEQEMEAMENRKREQEYIQRRRDSKPELWDIGIPVPRPRQPLPHEKQFVECKDPLVREILQRPEAPPPPILGRGQKSRGYNVESTPPPRIPTFQDELKARLQRFQNKNDRKQMTNKMCEKRASIDHDISSSHSCASIPNLPQDGRGNSEAGRSDFSNPSRVHQKGPAGNMPPHNHTPADKAGSTATKLSSLPRQPSVKGPRTAPKPNKGSIAKYQGAAMALTMVQNTRGAYNTSNRTDVRNKGAHALKSVPETDSPELSYTEQPNKVAAKGRLLSNSFDRKSRVASTVTLLDQRRFTVADESSSHHNHSLHPIYPESPSECKMESLVTNEIKQTSKADECQKHEYDDTAIPRNRPCGDGGNEVVLPPVDITTQKMSPNTKDIIQWADVPDDISTLTVRDISACLRLLNIKKELEDVDGTFLMELSKEELEDFFQMSGLEAKKIIKFVGGWRPKF